MNTQSTHSSPYNKKSPTVKRILREAIELAGSPSPDYFAEPLEKNLFEWHFTLRGPPETPYADGIYHGRINLPPTYPMRPPAFRFLTPSGRFEINREICLSISEHHEETWQPAWGVRTAVVALRGFMETQSGGQVGALNCTNEQRKIIAEQSRHWKCEVCGKTNALILNESEEAAKIKGTDCVVDEAPPRLKMVLKHNENTRDSAQIDVTAASQPLQLSHDVDETTESSSSIVIQPILNPFDDTVRSHPQAPLLVNTIEEPTLSHQQQPTIVFHREETFWIDRFLFALMVALATITVKSFLGV